MVRRIDIAKDEEGALIEACAVLSDGFPIALPTETVYGLAADATNPAAIARASVIYFRCADIALAMRELERRGVSFNKKPHLIAEMDDHDLWMAFFTDPDGHLLALMQEAPKGYAPPA